MCGIAGIVSSSPIPPEIPQALTAALEHRGPDDRGVYLSPDRTLALVHTRLSILDLSAAGRQPMTSRSCPKCGDSPEGVRITYNGEIYNFQELREELLSKGHSFFSKTDTEVLLHLYREEGEALVSRLNGMFAFGLYDPSAGRLLLARDRLGIKPLYYADHGGQFLFASEIKALLATGWVPREPDWQALHDYFTFLFIPHPQTAFRAIRQLPPAHTLTLDLKSRSVAVNRYWTPWDGPDRPRLRYEETREQVRSLLTDAVRRQMISDVPLGLFFSGGIDSTLLAALMAREGSGKVQTFTVVFEGSGFNPHDDLRYARLASQAIGTDHHELTVRLNRPEEFVQMVEHVDQPFANPTLYLQYLIAQATRKGVTVALSGVGGDELFGGYPKYWALPIAPLLQAIPAGVGAFGVRCLSRFREDSAVLYPLRRLRRLLRGAGVPLPEQYLRWSYALSEPEKASLLSGWPGARPPLPSSRLIRDAFALAPAGADRYDRIFAAELQTFLADNLLEYTDKATMAVALETRVPFLDHRLVELAARIPFRDKIHPGRTKVVLVDAFRDLFPPGILNAPKRGFSPPLGHWMETVLDRYFEETWTRKRVEAEGLFSWDAIQTLRSGQKRGRNVSLELVALIMFDVWHRRYILNP